MTPLVHNIDLNLGYAPVGIMLAHRAGDSWRGHRRASGSDNVGWHSHAGDSPRDNGVRAIELGFCISLRQCLNRIGSNRRESRRYLCDLFMIDRLHRYAFSEQPRIRVEDRLVSLADLFPAT